MTLNTRGIFSEFVSNIMITDDAIRSHKEIKKRKVVSAPSGSAPPKYQTMYHHSSTYPPDSHSSTSTNTNIGSSGLPSHLSVSTNRQHLGLYLHLRL
jgi:hypothetical protein